MSAHTPGPWVLFEVGGDHGTVKALAPAARETKTSILSITEDGGSIFAVVLRREDARLIVKAPELLHCLKVICCHAEGREDLDVALHLDVARALIAEVEAA
jgi:hypothetical protein